MVLLGGSRTIRIGFASEPHSRVKKGPDLFREPGLRSGSPLSVPLFVGDILRDTSKGRIFSRSLLPEFGASGDYRKAGRDRSSGSARLIRIESIFRSVCLNLDNVSLFFVAQLVAQLAEGFAL
jgi:hypothetical protein